MIQICPNCGNKLPFILTDGLIFCDTCKVSIDNTRYNRIMSCAWTVIRQNPESAVKIAQRIGLSQIDADLVEAFILDFAYSIEEFRQALDEISKIKKI